MDEGQWVEEEFGQVDLGDKRLNQRLKKLAQARMEQPNGSIPQSSGGKAATKAAYRLLDNEDVEADRIQAGHFQASQRRMKGKGIILAVQDTTELNYTAHPAIKGLGYLSDLQQHGMYVHSTLAVTPQRVPLGLIQQQVWIRPVEEYGKRVKRKEVEIEQKESMKWLKSLSACAEMQKGLEGSRIIGVGDSEADVYELFELARELNQDILIRACRDRCLAEGEEKLWEHLQNQALAGEIRVEVKREAGRKARLARVEIRFAQIKLRPPHRKGSKKLSVIEIWAVLAIEQGAPEGEKPIEWLLLTAVAVNTFADACERVSWYTCRWVIEMYHKVLKSGCRVEERQFDDYENLRRYLALDAVVAWQLLYMTLLSRATPDVLCTLVLETHEWQALYCYLHKTRTPPATPPSLKDVVFWIAGLGGFLGRKSDGHPGTKTLWLGLQRLKDIANAWLIFNPL